MMSLLLSIAAGVNAATAAVAGGVPSVVSMDADRASLLDTLAFKTGALLRDTSSASVATAASASATLASMSSSFANSSLVDYLLSTRAGASASSSLTLPFISLLPGQSTLLACLLAITLYVVSWAALAVREPSSEEDASTNASYTVPSSPGIEGTQEVKKSFRHQQPPLIRMVYSFFGCFMFAYRCAVYLGHAFLNRAVPFRDCSVYLRGFSCAQMPEEWTVSSERFRRTALQNFGLQEKAAEFCLKLLARSGLGECTYFPPGILSFPPDLSMEAARAEADYIFGNALDQLFASTGIKPKDVDILIVNCSLFAPTPSLAAMIINKYKMREDINSYNLSGMGCSAGLISLHLAKDLLRTHPNSLAVIVSTELITQQIYTGTNTNMLLQNSLFRSGGAAVALTNKSTDYAFGRVRYELEHTVRTTLAHDTEAYSCVYQDEDEHGHRGVRLEKSLMGIAGKAMTRNITRLGPKILPWSQQIKFGLNMVARKLDTKFRIVDKLEKFGVKLYPSALPPKEKEAPKAEPGSTDVKPMKPRYRSRIPEFVPNFKTAVDHICIHAGGRAVIDAIQAGLNLSDEDVQASRATLHRYGNTSSSSIWYEFRYLEQNRGGGNEATNGKDYCGIKRGEKVWQLGFGSGFKCNSAIWRRL